MEADIKYIIELAEEMKNAIREMRIEISEIRNVLNQFSYEAEQGISDLIQESTDPQSLVYGISGLAKLLKVSYPTAMKIKNSGKVSYLKAGDKFIFSAPEVLSQLKNL